MSPLPANPVPGCPPAPTVRGALSGALLLSLGLLGACGGSGAPGDGTDASAPGTTQPVNADARLLASNCFQCHGTNGTGGFENIRGEAGEVREYRDLARRPAGSDIMAAHAQGYTDAQIAQIIAYLQP